MAVVLPLGTCTNLRTEEQRAVLVDEAAKYVWSTVTGHKLFFDLDGDSKETVDQSVDSAYEKRLAMVQTDLIDRP